MAMKFKYEAVHTEKYTDKQTGEEKKKYGFGRMRWWVGNDCHPLPDLPHQGGGANWGKTANQRHVLPTTTE